MPSLKRKRGSDSTTTSAPSDRDAINAIFRANFESKFGTIDLAPVLPSEQSKESVAKRRRSRKSSKPEEEEEDGSDDFDDDEEEDEDENEGEDDDEEGEGADDDDNPPQPEVITYDFSRRGPPPTTKPSHRSFMSSKPPSSTAIITSSSKPQNTAKLSKSEQETEVLNLKNDQALHRLLSESHLLDGQTLSHSSGKNRHKAIESRIVSLGGAPLKQKGNIPMNIQKGMKLKQRMREEKVKREAKENGVIIDKESKRAKERRKNKERTERRKGGQRDAGVGHAKIGKFRGGELRLSRRDVAGMRA